MHVQPPTIDVASAAGAYASFGSLLVGFAFSGLLFYLTGTRHGTHGTKVADGNSQKITSGHVTVSVLFAMASLTMTSFLYADLAGEAVPQQLISGNAKTAYSPAWSVVALLPYGVA